MPHGSAGDTCATLVGVEAGPSRPSSSEHRPRVLLAEDHPDTREMYACYLALEGFDVQTAADGHSAIRAVLEWRPDIVVIDLSLPQLDGGEAARRLKADSRTAHIPIIACTGRVIKGPAAAIEAGCHAYVAKPCPPEDLLREVRRVLGQV